MRTFKKIGLIGGGGLAVLYVEEKKRGVETHYPEVTLKDTSVPHPDLTKIFDDLREPLLALLGVDLGRGLLSIGSAAPGDVTLKQRNAIDVLHDLIETGRKRLIENLEVNTVTISGDGEEKQKILLSGTLVVANGSKVAVNSPLVSLSGSTFGVETTLETILDRLLEETSKYLDEDKRAQLSLFGPENLGGEDGAETERDPAETSGDETDEPAPGTSRRRRVAEKVA